MKLEKFLCCCSLKSGVYLFSIIGLLLTGSVVLIGFFGMYGATSLHCDELDEIYKRIEEFNFLKIKFECKNNERVVMMLVSVIVFLTGLIYFVICLRAIRGVARHDKQSVRIFAVGLLTVGAPFFLGIFTFDPYIIGPCVLTLCVFIYMFIVTNSLSIRFRNEDLGRFTAQLTSA